MSEDLNQSGQPRKTIKLSPESITAAKMLFMQGKTFNEISHLLDLKYKAIFAYATRHGWPDERANIRSGKSTISAENSSKNLQKPTPEALICRNLAEDARLYKESMSKEILDKGLKVMARQHVENTGEVSKHFSALSAVHNIAKDVFGIGKEQPTPNLVVNMGFLSKEADDEPQKPVIDIEQVEPEPNQLPE